MSASRCTTIIAASCLAASMTASVFLLRHLDQIRPKATIEDVLYIESPKMVKRASLGFNGLMACLYWTRSVQYFGHRHHERALNYSELAPLLEITTTLDPQLFPAYEFGASFLAPQPPNGAGQPDRAIQLMEYGIAHNPDDWHLYYELAFVYYTELKDYKKASEIFDRGSRVPNAHPFMKVMAAQTAEHAGDYMTARMLWSATFETSRQEDIRRNALEHLRAIQVDDDVSRLQAAVTRFGQRAGRLPVSISELCAAEHLPGIPTDPDGKAYAMTPEGLILVQNPDDFPFISKGLPPGYKPSGLPKFHTKG
jgi:tetratricopeptide (TPR) repeat protein